MHIDYQELNREMIKNKYLIPRIEHIMDQCKGAKNFYQFDLGTGYHQMLMEEDSISKMICVTRYGSYKFPVM